MTARKTSGAAAPRRAATARTAKAANIAPATTQDASGAIIETDAAKLPDHPAVDRNPREGTTVDQNRQDFNDPTKTSEEAVSEQLRDQA